MSLTARVPLGGLSEIEALYDGRAQRARLQGACDGKRGFIPQDRPEASANP